MTEWKPNAEQPGEDSRADLIPPPEPASGLEPGSESGADQAEPSLETPAPQPEPAVQSEELEQLPEIEAPTPAADAEQTTPPEPSPAKQPGRMRRFLVRTLRWGLGIGVVFGLGALLIVFTFYIPARQSLKATAASLAGANRQVDDLQAEIADLQAAAADLQASNADLTQIAGNLKLHALVLSARADIASAQLALLQEEPDRVRVLLAKTPQTLAELAGELPVEHRQLVAGLNERLDQALEALATQTYASESDLDVIATALLELENAYFSKPASP